MWNRAFLAFLLTIGTSYGQYSSKVLAVRSVPVQPAETDPRIEAIKNSGIKVTGTIFQVVPDGVLFKGIALIPGKVTRSVPTENLLHPGQTRLVVEDGEQAVPLGDANNDIIFISVPTDGLVDGKLISGTTIFPCGTYSYTTALGATKTVPKYAHSWENAYVILVSESK